MGASDTVARATVRIVCSNGINTSVGTSFLFKLEIGDDKQIPLLITNRHVVEGFSEASLTVSTAADPRHASPNDCHTVPITDFQHLVIYHPNPEIDLAAIFLGPVAHAVSGQRGPLQQVSVRECDLVDDSDEASMRYVEDVLIVGYPQGLWDDYRNLPIFRSGITATPAMLDYQNEPKFLIDCSIFPGSSGSPVFLYNSGVVVDARQGKAEFGERVKLLGVVYAVMIHQINGQVEEAQIPTANGAVARIGMPNNLGVVVKAREIKPLLRAVKEHFASMQAREQARGAD